MEEQTVLEQEEQHMPLRDRAKYGAPIGILSGVALELMGGGGLGLLLALGLGTGVGYFAEEFDGIVRHFKPASHRVSSRTLEQESKVNQIARWMTTRPASVTVEATSEDGVMESLQERAEAATSPAQPGNPVFAQAQIGRRESSVKRITVDEMVAHTTCNSYEVWLGRSLTTKEQHPAVKINFFKRHIKIIGASQHGKSSMAGALMESIARTHDAEHVLFALLDLENKTSRLFADLPHVAEVIVGDQVVPLHARSYSEVLQCLELLVSLIDYRATLSERELDEQALVIVYLEEFIDLKDHFKQAFASASEEEQERAQYNYTRLVYCLKKIAARGLKYYVQLLMCAQVDYADEDLKEALANVTSGLSFCVKPTAARAAGFFQTKLLQQNAEEDQLGQCVAELPECKDLLLAPEYDLKAKLRTLGEQQKAKKTVAVNIPHSPAHSSFERVNGSGNIPGVNDVNDVNALQRQVNVGVNDREYSQAAGNIHKAFTSEQEAQVLRAYAEMLSTGEKITRTGLREKLGWNNRQFSEILKPICDRHGIATREEG